MTGHRYVLEKYKGINTRYTCPSCGGKREFTRYIDTTTNEHLAEAVGMCNRLNSCGYHYTPKQYFEDNPEENAKPKWEKPVSKPQLQKPTFQYVAASKCTIDVSVFKDSLRGYVQNKFVQYLHSVFDVCTVAKLTERYYIGTSGHWPGAVVFWQVDTTNKIRAGKVMLYDGETGKRVKQPYNHVTWVHNLVKPADYELRQCFFGEHLLQGNKKPVAIAESEKTAIIASIYMPQYVWLACGGMHGLNKDKWRVLEGRDVTIFPDLGGYAEWKKKGNELSKTCSFGVSNFLERTLSLKEKEHGMDIADYLVQAKHKEQTYDERLMIIAVDFHAAAQKHQQNEITDREYLNITKATQEKVLKTGYSLQDFVALTRDM